MATMRTGGCIALVYREHCSLEPVINFRVSCAGSQFFRVQGARSDGYRVSPSDE
jgi:hypothetical protein